MQTDVTKELFSNIYPIPLKLDWPVMAVWDALVADGDPAGRAGLVAGAGPVAAPVQSSGAHSLAFPLAPDVGVVAA